jgi:hypothetical protein
MGLGPTPEQKAMLDRIRQVLLIVVMSAAS